MRKKTKKIISITICVLLALAMVLGCVLPAFADDLGDLEAQQRELEDEQAEQQLLLDATEEELAAAQEALDTAKAELEALDEQLVEVGKRIASLNTKISENQTLLTATEAQLETQRDELKTYYEQFKGRIQMMYETNQTNYLEVLLSASSIAELFSRLEYISEVVKYDNEIIDDMNRVEQAIVDSKETIQQTKTELEQDKAQQEVEQANLQDLLAQKQIEVDALNSNALAVALMKQEQEAAMAEINSKIYEVQVSIDNEHARIEEESRLVEERRQQALAEEESRRQAAAEESRRQQEAAQQAQQAQQNSSTSSDDDEDYDDGDDEYYESADTGDDGGSDNGGYDEELFGNYASAADRALDYGWQSWPGIGAGWFYWPVDCYLISSLFGPRIHPITGEYSNHGGLDIAAQYGQPIYAGASGTVVASYDGWNDGWGNYVMIDHGNGTSTLYAHQSERACEVGDYVEMGQVIGYVGSTGMSTGPHLHFEVYIGGGRVDPELYL